MKKNLCVLLIYLLFQSEIEAAPAIYGEDSGIREQVLRTKINDEKITGYDDYRFRDYDEETKTSPFSIDRCPECVVLNPIEGLQQAAADLGTELPTNLSTLRGKIQGGDTSTVISKIRTCSRTVTSMRSVHAINTDPFSTRYNMLQGFKELCLPEGKASSNFLDMCRNNYQAYVDNCLSNISNVYDHRIADRVGILFKTSGKDKGLPSCTATVISNKFILTARHCYVLKEDDKVDLNGNDYLTFTPSDNLLKLMPNGNSYNGKIEGELTIDGIKDIELLTRKPNLDDDVIVLALAFPLTLERPTLSLKFRTSIAKGEQITILGYQEMATRKDDLYSTAFYLPDGKNQRYYLQNIMMDDSLTCFAALTTLGGFTHNCQSLNGTSGAPLFVGDLEKQLYTDNNVFIVGIQSGGNESPSQELEKQGVPNVAAMIYDTTIQALAKQGVDTHY